MLEEFNKCLDDFYKKELLENYDKEVIDSIDVNNGKKVLELLKKYNFYFLEDVILNYIDIFMMNADKVEEGIIKLREKYGDNYLIQIGDNYLIQIGDNYLIQIGDNLEILNEIIL